MRLLEVFDYGVGEMIGCSSAPEFESFVLLEEATGKSKEDILIKNDKINHKFTKEEINELFNPHNYIGKAVEQIENLVTHFKSKYNLK